MEEILNRNFSKNLLKLWKFPISSTAIRISFPAANSKGQNQILERNYALMTIWGENTYFNARSMDVYITKLRKHLKVDPTVQIMNIHGKGYKLVVPEKEA